jgi:hAT family C-terminal dimerisation region
LSFLYLERVFKDASGVDAETKIRLFTYLKMRYATIYSAVHFLAFYLDPAFVKIRQASRMSGIKPYTTSDALACIAAAKALLNHGQASVANRTSVEDQIVSICTSAAPYLSPLAIADNASFNLPHVWWEIMADTAPIVIKRVAALVFSCAAMSASGERSFKARSRVHTRTRNRLSNDGADKSQAILFNRLQSRRAADGALLSKRTSGIESRIVAALLYEGPLTSAPAAGHVPDAADEDDDGDVVGGCPAGGEDVELGALADGAEDGLMALEKALVGLISEEEDDDCVL